MVNKTFLITISILFVYHLSFSQKEANLWYFGENAGISFNQDKSGVSSGSKMNTSEGCAIHSTYGGRLLFYTDGMNVWDSTHNIMPNGNGLKGDPSSTQSAIIIPKPFTFNSYYIFTTDNVGGTDGITYSEVNMNYNKGKGDVLYWKKNKKLITPACEKITAVKHANGKDYWILVHKFNSDLLFAYRVTGYGVSTLPVVSKTGFNIAGAYANTLGYMKFSPDGRKVAYANYALDSTAVGDFDASTGKVNNIWIFPHDDAYGIEFSQKSKYLYVGEFRTKKIFQYDVKALSKQSFIATKTIIDSNYSNDLGALQLSTDGKIYISVTGSNYLQVIHSPDSSGIKSHPQKDFLYLNGKTCLLGLPNFNASIFNKKTILVKKNCLRDSTAFSISNTNDLDSVKWNFGDPQSGKNNYSNKVTDIYHSYSRTGYYAVSLFYYYKKTFGRATYKFFVRDPKPYLGKDTTFCNAFSLDLSAQRNYSQYKWNNNNTSKIIPINQKGTYILTVTDSGGCAASDTLVVKNPVVRADFIISDTLQCLKNNVFAIEDMSSYDDDIKLKCIWDFGDGTKLTDGMPRKEYVLPGTFRIRMTVESMHHCYGSIEKTVKVLQNPVAQFISTTPCFPDCVQFTNKSSTDGGKIIAHLWDFGDKTTSTKAVPAKFYEEPGKYNVKLTIVSDNGCVDSVLKFKGVLVKQKPEANFTFSELSSMNNGKRVVQFSNASSNDVIKHYWNFGKGRVSYEENPTLNFMDSGSNKFILKVTNDVGCTDTFSVTTFHKFYFYLPDAFSPDANNINETFEPVSSLFVNSYRMEIFNLWGEKLFESKDFFQGWDGDYLGKPSPDGIYICKISFTPFNGILQNYESNIRLLR